MQSEAEDAVNGRHQMAHSEANTVAAAPDPSEQYGVRNDPKYGNIGCGLINRRSNYI